MAQLLSREREVEDARKAELQDQMALLKKELEESRAE